jgi:hypothetical protein
LCVSSEAQATLASAETPAFAVEAGVAIARRPLYFVDMDGVIRDQHLGEGRYEKSERVIQQLLGVERELGSVVGTGVEAAADWNHLLTPETYVGYERGVRPSDARPERLRVNTGHWTASGPSGPRT